MNLKTLLKIFSKTAYKNVVYPSTKMKMMFFYWYVGDVRLESADVRQAPQGGSKAAGRKQTRAKTFRAL
jgi:hypothetical protein